ncbi:MAG: 2-dehydropantoate 2-reductase [Verrucomicrobiota bacterium]
MQESNKNLQLPKDANIAVVGSGAVGCFYGARLARVGNRVSFLMRADAEHVRQNGLKINSYEGNFLLSDASVFTQTQDMGVQDLVIVALKATDNHVLPQLLKPLVGSQTIILTLQNGLGNEEFLTQLFHVKHIMGGVCFVCLNRIAPGVIQHFKHGHIEVGEFSSGSLPRTEAIAKLFENAGITCTLSDNLQETRWRKLVWNIPFNGLSISEGGLDVSQLLANPQMLKKVEALMEEIITTATALGIAIPPSFIRDQISKTRVMGPYRPSSLIDYELGRAVEVESIWGEPLRRAQAKGLFMPRLSKLYHSLKDLFRHHF